MAKNLNKDTVYRAAKPKEKDYMINDGGGLYMLVTKNGTRSWLFVYTFNQKRRKTSLGIYPANTLEAARIKALTAAEDIAKGINHIGLQIDVAFFIIRVRQNFKECFVNIIKNCGGCY